jgi:hypothetical protein
MLPFRHFFRLQRIGRNSEIGGYYFQLRSEHSSSYIKILNARKWDHWRREWMIVTTPFKGRLELAVASPPMELEGEWEWKPKLESEFNPVLDRIKELADAGVTSLIVASDFLNRRIAPLQAFWGVHWGER